LLSTSGEEEKSCFSSIINTSKDAFALNRGIPNIFEVGMFSPCEMISYMLLDGLGPLIFRLLCEFSMVLLVVLTKRVDLKIDLIQ
jgi:hypothetical protein